MDVKATTDWSQLAALEPAKLRAMLKGVIRKAGSTALRDMRSEANTLIRAVKRIPLKYIRDAITIRRKESGDIADMEWSLAFSDKPVPLVAYPHRQTKNGVTVEVNPGKRTLVPGAFEATMKSGHKGVFKRVGTARLPIRELLGSRPVDALLRESGAVASAVAERGRSSLLATFDRLLTLEIGKLGK